MADGRQTELGNAARSRCLVLFSGGLDSTTLLAIARSEGFQPLALIFDYGQRHAIEIERAAALAGSLGIEYRLVRLDLRSVGGSALTSGDIAVPVGREERAIREGGVPATYVPARNTLFLSYALAWAEVLGIADIYIGVNSVDFSGYPDCRREFVEAFERLANVATRLATEGGKRIRIHAPLLEKTKAEIIRWGLSLGVDYSKTWSCYAPVRLSGGQIAACGLCDSCFLRRKGFEEAGVEDPIRYAR